ncbi:hypothetical protein ACFTXJ_01570 [Streptomyces zhihengii]|uniref:hypothetical protein n=1 Tax=Streptomyces zhihengii TaxID=1818004 RepID=UPI003627421B
MTRWERPAAGREPAAAALLGWLADPQAPGLCLVSGSQGCGKSELLAWFVRHGSRSDVVPERAVHAVALPAEPEPAVAVSAGPLAAGALTAGQSVLGAVWAIADQLGIVARAPGELVAALERDARRTVIVLPDVHDADVAGFVISLAGLPQVRLIAEARSGSPAHRLLSGSPCAELDLDRAQWRDEERFALWREAVARTPREAPQHRSDDGAAPDLSDPVAVCEADPWKVTAAYERDTGQEHGGLRAAWLRAGQALCAEPRPATRALTLLGVLGDGADPRIAVALHEAAAGADWRMLWRRVRGDVTPPWSGPVTAAAVGQGPLAGSVVLADAHGVVQAVSLDGAATRGRLPELCPDPLTASVLPDGTVLVLDDGGRVTAHSGWATRSAGSGLAGLLADGPGDTERLLDALRGQRGTALAHAAGPGPGTVALGGADGTVRLLGDVTDAATLHNGPVRALAVLDVPLGDGVSTPLFYSGGTDGAVRAWAPGSAPMAAPVLRRSSPVVCLDAAVTAGGATLVVAWGDGLVEYVGWDSGVQQTFRPGPPVRAVALDGAGRVVIGMDEALTCLVPRQERFHEGGPQQPPLS